MANLKMKKIRTSQIPKELYENGTGERGAWLLSYTQSGKKKQIILECDKDGYYGSYTVDWKFAGFTGDSDEAMNYIAQRSRVK